MEFQIKRETLVTLQVTMSSTAAARLAVLFRNVRQGVPISTDNCREISELQVALDALVTGKEYDAARLAIDSER